MRWLEMGSKEIASSGGKERWPVCVRDGGLLRRLVLRTERWLLRRFDSVSSISRRMVDQLQRKGVDPKRTRYFPNWVDISHVRPSLSGASYRMELGIANQAKVVLFSGSLGGKQGLTVIPQAARHLAGRTDIVFVICGDGVMKLELEADSADLPNVRFLSLQPFERLGELLSMADIHLLPQSPEAADLVLPSKLSGMLASGRPVIAVCRSGTEIDSVVSLCGIVIPPLESFALADAVRTLVDDPDRRLELGRRAREFAETHFERDAILQRMFGSAASHVPSAANDAIA